MIKTNSLFGLWYFMVIMRMIWRVNFHEMYRIQGICVIVTAGTQKAGTIQKYCNKLSNNGKVN